MILNILLIKSPDEWAITKQACQDESVVYLFFSSHKLSGIWTHIPLITGRVWSPLHYQSNPAVTRPIWIANGNFTWYSRANVSLQLDGTGSTGTTIHSIYTYMYIVGGNKQENYTFIPTSLFSEWLLIHQGI